MVTPHTGTGQFSCIFSSVGSPVENPSGLSKDIQKH